MSITDLCQLHDVFRNLELSNDKRGGFYRDLELLDLEYDNDPELDCGYVGTDVGQSGFLQFHQRGDFINVKLFYPTTGLFAQIKPVIDLAGKLDALIAKYDLRTNGQIIGPTASGSMDRLTPYVQETFLDKLSADFNVDENTGFSFDGVSTVSFLDSPDFSADSHPYDQDSKDGSHGVRVEWLNKKIDGNAAYNVSIDISVNAVGQTKILVMPIVIRAQYTETGYLNIFKTYDSEHTRDISTFSKEYQIFYKKLAVFALTKSYVENRGVSNEKTMQNLARIIETLSGEIKAK